MPDTSPPRRNPSNLPVLFAAPWLSLVTCHESRVTKSSRINTYETSRKYCKQRTYRIAKSFRFNTCEKQGVGVLWLTNCQIRAAPKVCRLRILPVTCRPSVPLQPATLGATMPSGARILRQPGETTPLYPVSNRSERTSVTATARRRPGLQVVPGSTVLTVDPSRVARSGIQMVDAEKHRVGKAGSVRMG